MRSMRNGWRVMSDRASEVRRICPPPSPNEPSISIIRGPSTLHANDLTQRMHDVDEIALRRHHRVDRLVGRGRLIEHVVVLAALDAGRGLDVVLDREAALGLGARHAASRPVAAAVEALR